MDPLQNPPAEQSSIKSISEKPNAPWALSRVNAALKLANISLIEVPTGVEPGPGFLARFSTPFPPSEGLDTICLIAAGPPSLSARYAENRKLEPTSETLPSHHLKLVLEFRAHEFASSSSSADPPKLINSERPARPSSIHMYSKGSLS